MTERTALIVGGGIGGLTAALCCAQQGMSVSVFEQAPEFVEAGAGIQVSPNCTRVLHDLGLESELKAVGFLPEGVEMREWKNGRVLSFNPLGDAALGQYGFPYYHVHRADLLQVLVKAARANPRIALHTDARVDGIDRRADGVGVEVGGATHEGDLLVGADGIHSLVRAALFGAEAPTFTGNVAWRGLVAAERLPEGLVRPMATAWLGPKKHFVHYYVRRGELVNCVCVVEKQGWEVESWTERGDQAELKADFSGWHETIQLLIDNLVPDACYKWALFDRPPMARWSDGCVTLLGDACHPTLPFMAQGAAMAIEDSAVLARCVAAAEDIRQGLARYESLRRARTAGVQVGSRRNAKVFHLAGPRAWLRNRVVGRASSSAMRALYEYDALKAVEV